MRPVTKGDIPQISGTDKTVSDYKDWRQDLIDRIGNFCSYCNMVLNDSPQVEHVAPKSTNPALTLTWSNMLLACGPCNRAKSNLPYDIRTHYIPDYHNTHLAFDYVVVSHPKRKNTLACIPVPKQNLAVNIDRSNATIELFKLDALTSNPRATDLRWKYRYEAHQSSRLWRNSWDDWGYEMPVNFIPLLIDAAVGKGFFSIWFECFDDVPAVKKALLDAFPGSRMDGFSDADFSPVPLHEADL